MQAEFLDLYRASVRSATSLMRTSLEQTQRFQQQQLDMVRGALDETSRAATQVDDLKNLDDLMAHNSRLAGAQLERMTELWSGMWRAAAETQKSMLDLMQVQMGQAKDRMREGYAFTTRATEDAARVAATQLTGAANQAREAAGAHEKQPQRKSA